MKKLFEAYINLPMSFFVVCVVVIWSTVVSIVLTPAILVYVEVWCMVLFPFLLAISYTEHKHDMKRRRAALLVSIKEDLGEDR